MKPSDNMDLTRFTPPFMIVSMDLNKDGFGPETDGSKVVKTEWQIWDAALQTVSRHETESQAWKALALLNSEVADV